MPTKKTTESQVIETPKAIINGVEYTLDSTPEGLTEVIKDGRWDPQQRKMVDVEYLPINAVYELLGQLAPTYGYDTQVEKFDEFSVEEVDKRTQQKATKKYLVMSAKVSLRFPIGEDVRYIEGYAQSIASSDIYTKDNARAGFISKLEARALKNACKKLGRVFRIASIEHADEIQAETQAAQKEASVDVVVAEISAGTAMSAKQMLHDDIVAGLKPMLDKFVKASQETNPEYKLKQIDLVTVAREYKEANKITDNSDKHNMLKQVAKELLSEYNVQE